MSKAPSKSIVSAIETGFSTITRRVEMYEYDGVTPWNPDLNNDPNFARLVDGTINVDYTRDERRTVDMTLRNDDGLLRADPTDGLWYDKVVKVFRGIEYSVAAVAPAIAIIEMTGAASAPYQFRSLLLGLGMTRTDVYLDAASVDDLSDYDIIISNTATTASAEGQLLRDCYAAGKSIVTIGTGNTGAVLPFVTSTASVPTTPITFGLTPLTIDNPLTGAFIGEAATPTATGAVILAVDVTAQRVAQYTSGGYTNHITATLAENDSDGNWLDIHLPNVNGAQAQKVLKAGITWMQSYSPIARWEIQMGEFVIDSIADQNFPFQVKITGRDYTKKCLVSKFEKASTFVKGTKLNTLIRAVAANCGIKKFKLPPLNEALASDISADRGSDRWSLMKLAATTFGYEIFFDNQGYLTMRKFLDPSFSPVTATFQTGKAGNLVSYERNLNDSRLFNHVVIIGDPADGEEDRLPYFGEAKNTEPSSPTRIERIGDRYWEFSSTLFTSDKECRTLALSMLKIHSLESYELSVGAIYYPWLEAGEIVLILDPDRTEYDPTRFLMTSINYSLGLGPMTLTANRVTFVADPNSADVPDDDSGSDEAA